MDEMFFWFVCLVYFCRLSPLPLAWLLDRWLGDPAWLQTDSLGRKVDECGECPRLERWAGIGSADCGSLSFHLLLSQGDRRVFHRIDGSDKDPADILLPGWNDVDT